jgi:hypothetical protein
VQGRWFLPDGFEAVWNLVDHACYYHPDWEPPAARTVEAWREAQIFAGVRIVLVEAGSLDPAEVVREARLTRDLGLE